MAQLGFVADARRHVGEEARGPVLEGEDPQRDDALGAVDVERDVVGGRRAVGVWTGGAGRGEGRAEGGQRDVERLAEHRRAQRTPVARSAASFHDSTRPSRRITNMPSLIDEMTPRSRASEPCTACSTFER